MDHLTYLSLGSNIGDREAHLQEALARLRAIGDVKSVSSFYETEPVEFTEQAWFLNCVVALETPFSPDELLTRLLQIERGLGRERTQKKGPRTIDIDILLYGDTVVDSHNLKVPHPSMAQRRFVLMPLAEIAPETMHPFLKKTARQLLNELPAGQKVWKFCKSHP